MVTIKRDTFDPVLLFWYGENVRHVSPSSAPAYALGHLPPRGKVMGAGVNDHFYQRKTFLPLPQFFCPLRRCPKPRRMQPSGRGRTIRRIFQWMNCVYVRGYFGNGFISNSIRLYEFRTDIAASSVTVLPSFPACPRPQYSV